MDTVARARVVEASHGARMRWPTDVFDIADSSTALTLFAGIADCDREIAAVAYLDPNWSLLALRHTAGRIGSVDASIRAIVRDAVAVDCTAVVIAHNHPSGHAAPSDGDLAFTRLLVRTLHAIGIDMADHLILTANGACSMRGAGYL